MDAFPNYVVVLEGIHCDSEKRCHACDCILETSHRYLCERCNEKIDDTTNFCDGCRQFKPRESINYYDDAECNFCEECWDEIESRRGW